MVTVMVFIMNDDIVHRFQRKFLAKDLRLEGHTQNCYMLTFWTQMAADSHTHITQHVWATGHWLR